MKRLLSLFLALSLIVSIGGFNVSAKNNEHEYTEALEVLSRLGIVDIVDLEDFDSEQKVSRAEFAKYLASALRLSTDTVKVYFADVPKEHSYAKIITAFVENGIIDGYGDGYFYPDDIIEPAEAYKMIARALGYGDWAEAMGGYPAGYIKTAEQMDIIPKNVSSEMTNAQVFSILHRACMTDRYMLTSTKGNGGVFSTVDNTNIYYTLYGIEFAQGIVTAAGGVDLEDETNRIRENVLTVENVEYYLGTDTYKYLGSYVNIFYYPDSKDEENTVLYIHLPERKNNTMIITSEMFDSFSDNSISYFPSEDSHKLRKVKLASNGVFCLNRGIYSKAVSTIFDDFKYGTIILNDTDSDDVFDVVNVKSYKNIVAGIVDVDKSLIYNKLKTGEVINLEEYSSVIICDSAEKELDIENITQNSILSIAESVDKNYAEIIVSQSNISGKLSNIENKDEGLFLTVDDEIYLCDGEYKEYIKELTSYGMSYTFYCDAFGRIVYVSEISSEGMITGYLIKAYFNEDDMTVPVLRIYNEASEMVKLSCAEKVRIDGTSKKKAEDVIMSIPNTYHDGDKYVVNPQIIQYKLDENGNVREIDTSEVVAGRENFESSLSLVDKGEMRFDHVSRLGMKAIIGSDTKVFKVPFNDDVDDKAYSIDKSLQPYTIYNAEVYTTNIKEEYADAIVIKTASASNIEKNAHVVMVADINEYLNDDDEVKTKLTYYKMGSKYENDIDTEAFESNEILKTLTPGDLCVFGINALNEINDVLVFYDYSEYKGDKPIVWSGYNSATGRCWYNTEQGAQSNLIFGYVNQRAGNTLRLGYSMSDEYNESHRTTQNVIVYDSTRKKDNVYTMPVTRVYDYMSVGMNCDTAIIQTKDYRNYGGIFIYR